MKNFIKLVLSIHILLMLSVSLLTGAGTSTGEFLKIPFDARGTSLGSSVISEADGLDSLYWNPAGLIGMEKKEFMLSYNKLISDLQYMYFAFGTPVSQDIVSLGVGLIYFDAGSLNKLDLFGEPDGTVSSYNMGGTAGIGLGLGIFDLGVNLKFFHQQLTDEYKNSIFGADIGMRKGFFEDNIHFGLALKNVGVSSKIDAKSDSMPMSINFGFDYMSFSDMYSLKLIAGSEIIFDEASFLNVGFEYGLKQVFFIRTGYKYGFIDNPLGGMKGLNLGAGFQIGNFGIDVAWMPLGDLGYNIMSSINFNFGDNSSQKKYQRPPLEESELTISRRAEVFVMMEKYKEAIIEYYKIAQHDPNNLKVAFRIACIYSLNKQFKESLAWLEYVLQRDVSYMNKVETDPDLKYVHKAKSFADLLYKYNK